MAKEQYDDAISYYANALNYSTDKSIQDKKSKCEELKKSIDGYNLGMILYKTKDYFHAYCSFKQVSIKDKKRYDEVQPKIEECKKLYIATETKLSSDFANKKDYSNAINHIDNLITVGFADDNIKKLEQDYQEAQTKLYEEEANKETEATIQQAQEDANMYKPKKIVDSNGKQIWKIYISSSSLHFTGTYKGTGNFIVQLSDDNQDLIEVIANEIGDYVSDKTVYVNYVGWYYLQIEGTDGSWNCNWQ